MVHVQRTLVHKLVGAAAVSLACAAFLSAMFLQHRTPRSLGFQKFRAEQNVLQVVLDRAHPPGESKFGMPLILYPALATDAQLTRGEHGVIIAAIVAGFLGGVLAVLFRLPPIVISVLFVTGVVSLVYGFLGGIEGASFTVGALKLGGTMAALAGFTAMFNSVLVKQLSSPPIKTEDLVGDWKWEYGRGGWEGHLTFSPDSNGRIAVSGKQYRYKDERDEGQEILRISNGRATLQKDGRHLDVQFDVEDARSKNRFQLKTTAPLVLVPAFRGDLQPTDTDMRMEAWGFVIHKRPPGAP
ncbi:MAG TPA: hypothetical protein VMU45_14315 [Candidatus Eisenbacteria bacterium]|nr:hypothetical protein [Candidatus Eisenbacteria bacterium]